MIGKEYCVTGASQRVQQNGRGDWEACYICHKCGEQFATSHLYCTDEKTARDESDTLFDYQTRRFCYRCGYKLTTKEPVAENEHIQALNKEIDFLEHKNRELFKWFQVLRDMVESLGGELRLGELASENKEVDK